MCGRFTLFIPANELQLVFDFGNVPEEISQRTEFFPGSGVPVVVNEKTRDIDFYHWGLVPSWAKDVSIGKRMFNARCETLLEKPSFKKAFLRRRCLIPATSYYEWKQVGTRKVPYLFSILDEKAFMFAALWEYWMDSAGNEVYSTTIVTCEPDDPLKEYHFRMPVIFDRTICWQWMEDRPLNEISAMMKPYGADRMKIELAETI